MACGPQPRPAHRAPALRETGRVGASAQRRSRPPHGPPPRCRGRHTRARGGAGAQPGGAHPAAARRRRHLRHGLPLHLHPALPGAARGGRVHRRHKRAQGAPLQAVVGKGPGGCCQVFPMHACHEAGGGEGKQACAWRQRAGGLLVLETTACAEELRSVCAAPPVAAGLCRSSS